ASLLVKQGITRLDVIGSIANGVAKVPEAPGPAGAEEEDDGEEGARPARDPLGAFTVNLVAQAAAGRIDRLIGRGRELERTIHVLCRRRKHNPLFVADPGAG